MICRLTPPCRVCRPTVLHCRIIGDFRDGSPFYRGGLPRDCVGVYDRRRRSAVRLDDAGNSSHAHGFCESRILSTLFSMRIARFWLALVECFDLLSSLLCSPNLFCLSLVDCFPDARGSAPRAPRKPAGARLDRALWLAHSFVFLLGFVGRHSILAFMPIIMNYEL